MVWLLLLGFALMLIGTVLRVTTERLGNFHTQSYCDTPNYDDGNTDFGAFCSVLATD